jgi:signal transduction histidine kinase
MEISLIFVVSALLQLSAVVLQFTAAFCAFRLIRVTGGWFSWVLVSSALCIMALRRSISLWRLLSGDPFGTPDIWDNSVAVVISVFMLAGVFSISPLFRTIKQSSETLRRAKDNLKIKVAERTEELQDANAHLALELDQRKRAEIALEVERKKLFSVLNGLPAFVYLRGADFTIRFANRSFREIFGEPGDKPCYQILAGKNEPCENCQPLKVLKTNVPQQFEWTTPDSASTYDIYNYPFSGGDVPLVLTIGIDITERKRTVELLRCQHEQLGIQVRERTKELMEINETLKMEIAVRKRTEKFLMDSRQNLQLLASQLLAVQEEERRRVFTEIYDGIGQTIAGIKMHLKTIGSQLGENQKDLKVSFEQIFKYINIVSDNIRNNSWDNTCSIIIEIGFSSSLNDLINNICQSNQIKNFVIMDKIDDVFNLEKQINIYRIFQELLTNIVRHSYATQVSVSINRHDDHILFVIKDNGKGFDQDEVLSANNLDKGFGLIAMNERARLMGGSLIIRTEKDQGTKVRLSVPIKYEVSTNLNDHISHGLYLV